MWWRLGALGLATIGTIFCLIPVRTHAVFLDLSSGRPPEGAGLLQSVVGVLAGMYVTPLTLLVAVIVLCAAVIVGRRIIRGM